MELTDSVKEELCNACNACCKFITLVLPFTPANPKYSETTNYFIARGNQLVRIGDYTFVRIISKCCHLLDDKCSNPNPDKNICRKPGEKFLKDICLIKQKETK